MIARFVFKGGVGSGNFGHGGRPGKVGGSTSKTLYHGTNATFDKFETGRTTINTTTFGDTETQRHAIFLTDKPAFAQEYGSNVGKYKLVNANMAKLTDDLRYDFVDTLDPFDERDVWLLAKNTQGWGMLDGAVGERFSSFLSERGYDGITFPEDIKTANGDWIDGTTYALLNDSKLKY